MLYNKYMYGMPEAMVFGTDIFAICDKLGLVVTCDEKSSVKELFEKQRVGVDALKKRLRKRVRDAAFPRRILDAKSAPPAPRPDGPRGRQGARRRCEGMAPTQWQCSK